MSQLVSITQQGQISIPAKLRRALNLNKYKKAIVRQHQNQIIIEPVTDLLGLGGSLQSKAIKNKKIDKIRKLENKASTAGFTAHKKI